MIIKVGDVVEVQRGRSDLLRDAKIDNIQVPMTEDYEVSVMQVDTKKHPVGTITYVDVTFDNTEGNMHWARFDQIKEELDEFGQPIEDHQQMPAEEGWSI